MPLAGARTTASHSTRCTAASQIPAPPPPPPTDHSIARLFQHVPIRWTGDEQDGDDFFCFEKWELASHGNHHENNPAADLVCITAPCLDVGSGECIGFLSTAALGDDSDREMTADEVLLYLRELAPWEVPLPVPNVQREIERLARAIYSGHKQLPELDEWAAHVCLRVKQGLRSWVPD